MGREYPRGPAARCRGDVEVSRVIAVVRERVEGERRVAATPESTRKLIALGFAVQVERGAGESAGFDDAAYTAAGATLTDDPWAEAEVVLKVRSPLSDEVSRLRPGVTLVCVLQPERTDGLTDAIAAQGATALALERIPRVTRAQKMDVLSSMANLVGYRAVLEAAHAYEGFFCAQVTAAGSQRPARVLVIGAGVAGLAAVAAARALGAEVRAFDTRAAAREQVESLGATFLEVSIAEDGEGGGGYAKEMSQAFLDAEMALFRQQADEVDVIITTALVPGKRAPLLVPEDVVSRLRPGSVVVDLAAEQGGNCALTQPGRAVSYGDVTIVGYTDLPSRMARTASTFFATNVVHLLTEMRGPDGFVVNLDDDVIRPAVVVHRGEVLPPPPRAAAPPTPAKAAKAAPAKVAETQSKAKGHGAHAPGEHGPQHAVTHPPRRAWGSTVVGLAALVLLFALGRFAPGPFVQHFTVFVLACFVGWQVIWSVSPSLHTPLMSVTNAISGIIIVGGLLQVGDGTSLASMLGAAAVLVAAINIAGGFLVTHRMLAMFHRGDQS